MKNLLSFCLLYLLGLLPSMAQSFEALPHVPDSSIHEIIQKYLQVTEIPVEKGAVTIIYNSVYGKGFIDTVRVSMRWMENVSFLEKCRIPDWIGRSDKTLVFVYFGRPSDFQQPESLRENYIKGWRLRFKQIPPPEGRCYFCGGEIYRSTSPHYVDCKTGEAELTNDYNADDSKAKDFYKSTNKKAWVHNNDWLIRDNVKPWKYDGIPFYKK